MSVSLEGLGKLLVMDCNEGLFLDDTTESFCLKSLGFMLNQTIILSKTGVHIAGNLG